MLSMDPLAVEITKTHLGFQIKTEPKPSTKIPMHADSKHPIRTSE